MPDQKLFLWSFELIQDDEDDFHAQEKLLRNNISKLRKIYQSDDDQSTIYVCIYQKNKLQMSHNSANYDSNLEPHLKLRGFFL